MNIEKRKLRKWLILPICLLFTIACEKVQFEPVVIPNTDLSFAKDIQPILTSNCVECHPPTRGLDFNPPAAYESLVPAFATVADSSNPQGSKLYKQLTSSSHTPRTSDIEKQEILKWISQGVPNN
jgi:hypothetical protein